MKCIFKTLMAALVCTTHTMLWASTDNHTVFARLDQEIDSAKTYQQRKENNIQRLKGNLRLAVTPTDLYLTCEQVAVAYAHYDSDSALVYYQKCRDLGAKEHKDVWVQTAVLGQAKVFADRGDNFISMQRLHSLGDISKVDPALRETYVLALMSNYIRSTTSVSRKFNLQSASSIWKTYKHYVNPKSIDYIVCEMIANKNYPTKDIIAQIKRIINKVPEYSYQNASCHMQLHMAYLKSGHYEDALREAALAEIVNLRLCDRSSPAMVRLVELINAIDASAKDMKRMVKYLQVCMNDINGFRDVGRGIHVVALQNGILEQYQKRVTRDRDITLTIILALAIIITLMLWTMRQRKQKICSTANKQTTQLAAVMAHQYHLLGTALTDVRLYKKQIANLITSGQNQKAVKLAKSNVLQDKTIEEYNEAFDRDFLSVFPNFVDSVNAKMNEDSKLKPVKDGALSPELRICALISLGVTDSKNIAEILQYSIQTVYNYRMKIRKGLNS